jgi:hypothetical protein
LTKDEIDKRKEQLKHEHTVLEILNQYGIKVNRGRCKAICHDGKKYTAKVSDNLYFCFKCNRNMDIFDIVMHFTNCDFWTAFESLGGTEEISFATYRKTRIAILEREKAKEELRKKKMKLREITTCIGFYQRILKRNEPLSDKWCHAMNSLQYQLYLFESYNERG